MASLAGVPVDPSNVSNLKDILLTYNKITEACFNKCVYTLNYRTATPEEDNCIQNCSGKFINGNQRIMQTFMEIQSQRQQAIVKEMEQQAQQSMAEASANAANATSDPPPASENTNTTTA